MRIPGVISSLNDNGIAENSRLAPQVGFNQCFLNTILYKTKKAVKKWNEKYSSQLFWYKVLATGQYFIVSETGFRRPADDD